MPRSGREADDETTTVNIAAEHPDAGDPLLEVVASALEHWGARVLVAVDADNLIRRLPGPGLATSTPAEISGGLPDPDARKGTAVAEVSVQGLPNLLHELVHVVLADRLDDDHGIDYHAIPFDLREASGRRVLFEELACCVASCAYLSRPLHRVGGRETELETARRVDAWFAEQIEIQPIFYGMEDDLAGFLDRVEAVAKRHRDELDDVMGLAYARCEAALAEVGAAPREARPARVLGLHELLRRQGRVGIV
jgi:hypothetical protein